MCYNLHSLEWHRLIRPMFLLIYLGFAFVIVPLLIYNTIKDGFAKKGQLILIGGLFLLTSLPISLNQIANHAKHLNVPRLQKPIIRYQ